MIPSLRAVRRPGLFALCCAAGFLAGGLLMGGAAHQWTTRKSPPGPPPAAPAFATAGYSGPQYALLIHAGTNAAAGWEFQDRTQRYGPEAMAQMFSLQPGDEFNNARIITAIASQGWELVSHTDSGYSIPGSINSGSSAPSDISRTEQWWFKKK